MQRQRQRGNDRQPRLHPALNDEGEGHQQRSEGGHDESVAQRAVLEPGASRVRVRRQPTQPEMPKHATRPCARQQQQRRTSQSARRVRQADQQPHLALGERARDDGLVRSARTVDALLVVHVGIDQVACGVHRHRSQEGEHQHRRREGVLHLEGKRRAVQDRSGRRGERPRPGRPQRHGQIQPAPGRARPVRAGIGLVPSRRCGSGGQRNIGLLRSSGSCSQAGSDLLGRLRQLLV
mmetsp:Transcript_14785/g.48352  ORF Transcript_14785/g.48352 Transcript_14785/m.48352 type:complete len:236 (-) Transcript_14785:229-936(-)